MKKTLSITTILIFLALFAPLILQIDSRDDNPGAMDQPESICQGVFQGAARLAPDRYGRSGGIEIDAFAILQDLPLCSNPDRGFYFSAFGFSNLPHDGYPKPASRSPPKPVNA